MVPTVELSDGNAIPQLGLGVWEVPRELCAGVVAHAIATGYRAVDTAAAYGNEREVGEAVRASGEDVFVTTKVWNSDQGRERARRSFERSRERLGVEVDLLLIHWPAPSQGLYVETWKTFVELQREGAVRLIGVSNFRAQDLERVIEATGVVPVVNQVELHPRLQQAELRRFHAEHGIATEAWSPLAKGQVLDDPVIAGLAERYGRTPAQIVIRWHLQLGNIVIPRSVKPHRIEENFDVLGFELDERALDELAQLEAGYRTGPDPGAFA